MKEWAIRLHPRHSKPFDAELTVTTVREAGQPVTLLWSLRGSQAGGSSAVAGKDD